MNKMNFKIEIPDRSIRQALINKIDNLNKPKVHWED